MKKRIHYVSDAITQDLIQLNFTIIGAGGTGSQVLHNLAKMAIAWKQMGRRGIEVKCFDGDVVSEENVGRQGFYNVDIGLNKAMVLIDRLNYTYGLNFQAKCRHWEPKDKISGNIFITCVDVADVRIEVAEQIKSVKGGDNPQYNSMYWVDFGNTKYTGQVIIGTVVKHAQPKSDKFRTIRKLPNLLEMYPDLKEMESKQDQGYGCSIIDPYGDQELFINSTLANAGINTVYNMLKNYYTFSRGLYLNLSTGYMKPIPL